MLYYASRRWDTTQTCQILNERTSLVYKHTLHQKHNYIGSLPQQHTFQLLATKHLSENFKQPLFSLSHILELLSKWKELRNTNLIWQGGPLGWPLSCLFPHLIHDAHNSSQYHNLSQWPDWGEMRRVKEAFFFLKREEAQGGTFPHLSG